MVGSSVGAAYPAVFFSEGGVLANPTMGLRKSALVVVFLPRLAEFDCPKKRREAVPPLVPVQKFTVPVHCMSLVV